MAQFKSRVTINRPLPEVFAFYANLNNLEEWGSGILQVRQTSNQPVGIDATYTLIRQIGSQQVKFNLRVVDYEPHQTLVLEGVANGMPWASRSVLSETKHGTRLEVISHLELEGLSKLFAPVITWTLRKTFQADLANLKDRLEERSSYTRTIRTITRENYSSTMPPELDGQQPAGQRSIN